MEDVNKQGQPSGQTIDIPSTLEEAAKALRDAISEYNMARKKVDELKKAYLAMGGTIERKDLGPRNLLLYEQYKEGVSLNELSNTFKLTHETIRNIIGREKVGESRRTRSGKSVI
ncbi:hypothetical protein [Pedobacter sp. ASV28]|uniref:hypothetical protein n=1 Tax=Pedobacter sp. ASV28 TaxID=2795123 RepID=UPI0018EDDD1F|nr:hypothetical protein [Pedobacter sp. ASV28]